MIICYKAQVLFSVLDTITRTFIPCYFLFYYRIMINFTYFFKEYKSAGYRVVDCQSSVMRQGVGKIDRFWI